MNRKYRNERHAVGREVQQSVAEDSGLALLLVEGYQPPALVVSNNNSICEALQSSPEHVRLCDPFCGLAHKRATNEGAVVHYRCHAGLQCFSLPVEINKRKLAVIGGRAFSSSKDYREFVERVRARRPARASFRRTVSQCNLRGRRRPRSCGLKLSRAAEEFREKPVEEPSVEICRAREEIPASDEPVQAVEERRVERTPYVGLDRRAPFADSIRRFAEQIDAAEPSQIYESILAQSADLLDAERGSLWLFDEESNQLNIKAARGIPVGQRDIEAIRMGEGIAGSVISAGQPLVTTIDALGKQSLPERNYKTNSFISYPITIGARKIGVLNVTDKTRRRGL